MPAEPDTKQIQYWCVLWIAYLFTHADHEQMLLLLPYATAGSSGANPLLVSRLGLAALWGPAHGGANEAVVNMLEEIGTEDRIPTYIARAKDKNDSFRLKGFWTSHL